MWNIFVKVIKLFTRYQIYGCYLRWRYHHQKNCNYLLFLLCGTSLNTSKTIQAGIFPQCDLIFFTFIISLVSGGIYSYLLSYIFICDTYTFMDHVPLNGLRDRYLLNLNWNLSDNKVHVTRWKANILNLIKVSDKLFRWISTNESIQISKRKLSWWQSQQRFNKANRNDTSTDVQMDTFSLKR